MVLLKKSVDFTVHLYTALHYNIQDVEMIKLGDLLRFVDNNYTKNTNVKAFTM